MSELAVELWDTAGLFELLLKGYPDHIRKARKFHSAQTDVPFEIAAAYVGFKSAVPAERWDGAHATLIYARLQGDLAMENFSFHEEGAEAVRAFVCLALGAMLAKFSAGEITEPQFVIGDAHLVAFTAINSEAIEEGFQVA